MSDNYNFDMNTWYSTKDYKNLYRYQRVRGCAGYEIICYYTGHRIFSGSLSEVRQFMSDNCISHDKYIRWCMLDE